MGVARDPLRSFLDPIKLSIIPYYLSLVAESPMTQRKGEILKVIRVSINDDKRRDLQISCEYLAVLLGYVPKRTVYQDDVASLYLKSLCQSA